MSGRWRWRLMAAAFAAAAGPALAGEPGGGAEPLLVIAQASLPDDERIWAAIKGTGYREVYELFLEKFPSSRRAGEARDALAVLDGRPTAAEEAAAAAALLAADAQSPDAFLPGDPADDEFQVDIAQIQRDLVAVGCNAGYADGVWGVRSRRAATEFVEIKGYDIDGSQPSAALARAVAAASGNVCEDFARRSPQ